MAKRKLRPSMPYWWRYYEACYFCRNKNCNSCKAARDSIKSGWVSTRRDLRQKATQREDGEDERCVQQIPHAGDAI